jgi:hypothetical protein
VIFLLWNNMSMESEKKLHQAARNGNVATVNRLLREGIVPDARIPNPNMSMIRFPEFWKEYGPTPLHIASGQGHTKVVNSLIRAGAPLEEGDMSGATPLHWAAHEGHLSVVNALLKAGARVDASGIGWTTPLYLAAKEGHLPVVNALLRVGASPNTRTSNGETPLYIATKYGHLPVVKSLLKSGANPYLKAYINTWPNNLNVRKSPLDIANKKIRNVLEHWKRPERQTLAMKSLGNRLPPNLARRILEKTELEYIPKINRRPRRTGEKRRRQSTSSKTASTKRQRR